MDLLFILILPPLSIALISGGITMVRTGVGSSSRIIAVSVLAGGISLGVEILLIALVVLATGRGGEVIGTGGHP